MQWYSERNFKNSLISVIWRIFILMGLASTVQQLGGREHMLQLQGSHIYKIYSKLIKNNIKGITCIINGYMYKVTKC